MLAVVIVTMFCRRTIKVLLALDAKGCRGQKRMSKEARDEMHRRQRERLLAFHAAMTPEVRAKSAAGVKAWFDALPSQEKRRVVAIIQAKDRIAKAKSKSKHKLGSR